MNPLLNNRRCELCDVMLPATRITVRRANGMSQYGEQVTVYLRHCDSAECKAGAAESAHNKVARVVQQLQQAAERFAKRRAA